MRASSPAAAVDERGLTFTGGSAPSLLGLGLATLALGCVGGPFAGDRSLACTLNSRAATAPPPDPHPHQCGHHQAQLKAEAAGGPGESR